MNGIPERRLQDTYEKIRDETSEGGYFLNPDAEFTKNLVLGLLRNEDRYGYRACPCRLATGDRERDLDIICPCDYRDPDLADFGACYCALYVIEDIAKGKRAAQAIPERRPPGGPKAQKEKPHKEEYEELKIKGLPFPVWRCKVCGYLCARPQPPEKCPVCKVSKDRFERFM